MLELGHNRLETLAGRRKWPPLPALSFTFDCPVSVDFSALRAVWASQLLVSYDARSAATALRRIAKPTSPTANRDSVAGSGTAANVKVC